MQMMKIALSRMHFPVTSLGPGQRVGIWFQGCSIRCEGCISIDTWNPNKNMVDIVAVLDLLSDWLPKAEGVTITGGEPFDQFPVLKRILQFIRKFDHLDTFVYSGYSLEELGHQINELDGLVDLLMPEPLDIRFPQTKPLRGSDNQALHSFSYKGEALLNEIVRQSSHTPHLNLAYDGDTAWIAGVPKRRDLLRTMELLKKDGVDACSLEDERLRDYQQ